MYNGVSQIRGYLIRLLIKKLTHLPQCRIYTSKNWVIIGPGNGLFPVWCQAIIWINAALLSIGLMGTYFNEIWIGILSFSFNKMHLKMSSAKMAAILSRGRRINLDNVTKPLKFLIHILIIDIEIHPHERKNLISRNKECYGYWRPGDPRRICENEILFSNILRGLIKNNGCRKHGFVRYQGPVSI